MELPHLGKNCFESSCKQLDFLPMKCDSCANIFCREHIHYTSHNCPESYKKDKQIPVCPLCNALISLKKDELPDVVVGRHIDSDCQSDTAKQRRKIFTNKCSFKGCKQKELIPVKCVKCQKNYCLKHRHEQDHICKGFEDSGHGVGRAGAAAIFRKKEQRPSSQSAHPSAGTSNTRPQLTPLSSIGRDLDRQRRERDTRPPGQASGSACQAGMSEEQALAQAIQMSLADSQQTQPPQPNKPMTQQEEEDMLLAQAIAASEQEAQRESTRRQQAEHQENKKSSCAVS